MAEASLHASARPGKTNARRTVLMLLAALLVIPGGAQPNAVNAVRRPDRPVSRRRRWGARVIERSEAWRDRLVSTLLGRQPHVAPTPQPQLANASHGRE